MAKYDPLAAWLRRQLDRREVTLGFDDVERLIESGLPASAHRHQAWWSNSESHVQATAWMAAGWHVDAVDQRARRVRFRRVG